MNGSTVTILQLIAAVLSVPVVTAIVNLAGRAFLPAQRLRSTLKTDLALYNEMPASNAKEMFGEHIALTITLLNFRLQPERVTRRKVIVQGVFGLLGAIIALFFAVVLILTAFVYASTNGSLPVVSAVLVGAGGTAALVYGLRVRRRRNAPPVEVEGLEND
jgi:hypothetical protein